MKIKLKRDHLAKTATNEHLKYHKRTCIARTDFELTAHAHGQIPHQKLRLDDGPGGVDLAPPVEVAGLVAHVHFVLEGRDA